MQQIWLQNQLPQLQQHLQQLKQQQQQLKGLQQSLLECQMLQRGIPQQQQRFQLCKSISQPLIQQQQQFEGQFEEQQQLEDLNNNSVCVAILPAQTEVIDICIGGGEAGADLDQENIVSDLVQRYINCMNTPTTDVSQDAFRRKFEQLYFENNKLGQSLRSRVNEVAQLRKQFEELQAAKNQLELKLVHADRKVEEFERKIRLQQQQQQIQQQPQQWKQQQQQQRKIFGTYMPVAPHQTGEYESLPVIRSLVEEEEQQQQQQQPTLKGVEQLLSQLENKLNTLRLVTPQQQQQQQQQQEQYQYQQKTTTTQQTVQQQQDCNGTTTQVIEITKKQEFKICPVCGIAIEKELSQPEFELHVNSHFPYTD
jgi:hypothetical protein